MKNVMIIVMLFLMSSWNNVLIDVKSITGTVYSADDGKPLPGVTIQVKGTAVQSRSDRSGQYAIQVPENRNVLIFNLKHYVTKEEKINARLKIDVYLLPNPQKKEQELLMIK